MQQRCVPVGSTVLCVDFRIPFFRWTKGFLLADLDGEDSSARAYTTDSLRAVEHVGSVMDGSIWLHSAHMSRRRLQLEHRLE